MRFRRTLSVFLGVLGTLLIGITVTLFLVFPRVINQMALLLGNMGTGAEGSTIPVDLRQGLIHVLVALVIDIFLLYFFIWRPTKILRDSYQISGLVVRRGEGQAFIDTESVRQRVLNALAKIGDIQHADVLVTNDEGRAVIKLNIITDLSLNGPQKKNEINREVRKIVKDQLGIDVSGKPTINFTLAPEQLPVPLIPAGIAPRDTVTVQTPPPAPVVVAEPEPVIVTPPPVVVPAPEPETPRFASRWNESSRIQPLPYHEDTVVVPEPIEPDKPVEVVTDIPPADTLPADDDTDHTDTNDEHPVDAA